MSITITIDDPIKAGEVYVWDSDKLEQLKISKKSGVYILKDKNGETIYIGEAKNLGDRLTNHFEGDTHLGQTKSGRYIKHKDEYEYIYKSEIYIFDKNPHHRFFYEIRMIQKYNPPFNTRCKLKGKGLNLNKYKKDFKSLKRKNWSQFEQYAVKNSVSLEDAVLIELHKEINFDGLAIPSTFSSFKYPSDNKTQKERFLEYLESVLIKQESRFTNIKQLKDEIWNIGTKSPRAQLKYVSLENITPSIYLP
ncbi:nucleotide excision repair endonuclease [Neobacillus sp. M.A.Huq-85]